MHAAEDRREQHQHRRRHVEVENLLHQPHRRLVGRAGNDDRRGHEDQNPAMARSGRTLCASSSSVIPSSGIRTSRATASQILRQSQQQHDPQPRHVELRLGREQRAGPRTPAIMTGIVTGYNRIGRARPGCARAPAWRRRACRRSQTRPCRTPAAPHQQRVSKKRA